MPHQLINSEFVEREQRWNYWLKIVFNEKVISKVTITDHYQSKHKEAITNELILGILQKEINGENLKATKYQGDRKVYKWEGYYQERRYRLIFWFENNNSDWLWVRNCFQVS